MRKISIAAGLALTSMLFTGSAFAQMPAPTPGVTPAPGAPTDARTEEADKKIGVGGDIIFVIPIGDLSDFTGPQIGAVIRGGYRVAPPLELTARIGYLAGLSKDTTVGAGGTTFTVSSHLSLIPIWAGARYFFMENYAGLYGAAEIGLNILDGGGASLTRFGANIGGGYVISKDLPIDIRAQFSFYNLLGQNTGETMMMGLGIGAGYTFQF